MSIFRRGKKSKPVETKEVEKRDVEAKASQAIPLRKVLARAKVRRRIEEKIPYTFKPLPTVYVLVDSYWVKEPYAKVNIVSLPELGGAYAYYVDEVKLSRDEMRICDKLIDILSAELKPPEADVEDVKQYVVDEARRLSRKYRIALGGLTEDSWSRILYYIERNLTGFGPIHVMMEDYNIEDISCEGVGRPVYVWHRMYESLQTNLIFIDESSLDDFIVKLAHIGGKHISTAFPIVDAMLYGKHRLAATFKKEISPKGSTFTIRKFREKPFTITELIKLGTIDEEIAAYFWILLENKASIIVMGGTGAGKSTTLNALASLIKPGMKICTVEEIAELNFPHENWVQFVTRESYGLGSSTAGSIDLFTLVKTTLRYRPDYIVVGEVRGQEAFVLFQALATGHGGMCTIHAESIDYAVKRLTSPPMNVSEVYIPLMNVSALVERVYLPRRVGGLKFGRRAREVSEVLGYGEYEAIFKWDPINDSFISNIEKSYLLSKIAQKIGKSLEDLLDELIRRKTVLRWMVSKGIFDMAEVAKIITKYYINPSEVYEKAAAEIGAPIKLKVTPTSKAVEPIITAQPILVAPPEETSIEALDEKAYSILGTLISKGGKTTYGSLLSETPLTPVEFWRYLNTLKEAGYVEIKTGSDESGRPRTIVSITEAGEKSYRSLTGSEKQNP
jgi:flagellar protein FlaI